MLQKLPVRVATLPTSTAVPVSALYLVLAVWTLAQVCALLLGHKPRQNCPASSGLLSWHAWPGKVEHDFGGQER